MAELGRTADEYYLALKKLLPKGPAWELDDSSFFMEMLKLSALEFARVDADIVRLINESDPRTASVTLLEWFHQWGIPDECLKLYSDEEVETYVNILVAKISTQGLSFIELIQNLALVLGFTGVNVNDYDVFTVDSRVDERIYGLEWLYYIRTVTVDEIPITDFLTTSRVHSRLREWGNQLWECMVRSLAPCHFNIIFQYGSED